MLPYRESLEDQLEQSPLSVKINRRAAPGRMAEDHWHPCQELLFVFCGEAMQRAGSAEFTLHAGDTLLIAPGAVHGTFAVGGECSISVALFLPVRPLPTIFLPAGVCQELPALFARLQKEAAQHSPGSAFLMQGLVWQALGLLERFGRRLTGEPDETERSVEPLRRLEEYLRRSVSRPLSLREAAAFAGYTPAYFSRFFSRRMGVPFKAYMDRLRMEAACSMLADGMTVSETALSLSYETPSSFCRAFKRLTGKTPSQYQTEDKKR